MELVVEFIPVYKRVTVSYKTVYRMGTGVYCHGFKQVKTGDMERLYGVLDGWLVTLYVTIDCHVIAVLYLFD